MSKKSAKKIVIAWEGLPICASIVHKTVRHFSVKMFGTHAEVPFQNIEKYIGCAVDDLASENGMLAFHHELLDADLVVLTGWSNKDWLDVALHAKKTNKALRICLSVDNNLRLTTRQMLGSLYFRIILKSKIDFFFVAGRSSYQLLRFFGVHPSRIFFGYYGANSAVFSHIENGCRSGFVFAGQKIYRKGIDLLLDAFDEYKTRGGQYTLKVIGSSDNGIARYPNLEGFSYTGFLQPTDVARTFNSAKCLILPSRLEHWGTVVCEASACGCSLILSNNVGSKNDLLISGVNGFEFQSGNAGSLVEAMFRVSNANDLWHKRASKVSVQKSQCYDENTYLNSIISMVEDS